MNKQACSEDPIGGCLLKAYTSPGICVTANMILNYENKTLGVPVSLMPEQLKIEIFG